MIAGPDSLPDGAPADWLPDRWLRGVIALLLTIAALLALQMVVAVWRSGADGNLLLVQAVAIAVTLVSVVVVGRTGRARDLAGREAAAAAQALAEANATLIQSNADLAEFASVASHDLQTPVRNIMHAAEFLADDLLEVADPSAFEYLAIIEESSARMRSLVNSILEYANLNRGDALRSQRVDLTTTIEEVIREREEELERLDGTIEYSDLPSITIDPLQAFRVVDNVVGNALKYRADDRAPIVSINGSVVDGQARIDISDNGIGFDDSDSEAIFAMFRRLHPNSVYVGSGMGLAIVKRIVEQYGGTITATSEPGVGSTFSLEFEVAA